MKKVMVIVPTLGTGGGEKMAIDIAAHVDRSLIDITIVSLYPYEETILSQYTERVGLKVIYLHKKLGWDIRIIGELKRIIKEIKPDVIHTHLYVVPYVLLAAKRKTVKYHTVHNVADKEAEGLLRQIMRVAYRFGGFTPVAISQYCAKTFEEVYGRSVETIPTIINGVDINKFKPDRTKHSMIKLINIGRFYPQKNQKMLIKAFSEIHKQCPNTLLEIVGDGYLRSELEAEVRSCGLEDAVIMEGESNSIPKKLNDSDIYVMSSDFEGLPVSVLEAMATGLPIVSTKAGGTVDIVKDSINGLLVPIGDVDALVNAILRLVTNPEERKAMGEESRIMAKSFSIEECARKYQELYLRGNEGYLDEGRN